VPRADAVLLIAFGGPESRADVRPFLDNVLRGRPVPRARFEEVVHHYEVIGGHSPLNALTFRQAAALEALLRAEGPGLPVYVGMRNWTPYVADTLARMRDDGVRHALAIVLAAHRTEASWERYRESVDAARAALGDGAPTVAYAPSWYAHPRFVEAMADCTRAALTALAPASEDAAPALVFTAHSIPVGMAAASLYVQELETSCRLVAAALAIDDFVLAYQSRSGNPREPWLEPDVNDLIRARAERGTRAMVLVPIGFVCDHVEVLYDLDVEASATAAAAGVRLVRAAAVNDHPAFVRMLAEIVRAAAG